MSRRARKNYYSEIFHVMAQGINRENIFQSNNEKEKYLNILKENLDKVDVKVISYCIMSNHVHLLLFSNNPSNVANLMSKLNTKYAIYYNKINSRCGYVFRNRYRAEEIITDNYFMNCIRYIHNNPVKAGICAKKELYNYSSVSEYVKCKSRLIDLKFVKELFISLQLDYNKILKNDKYCRSFIEYVEDIDLNDEETLIKDLVSEYLKKKSVNLESVKKDIALFREIVDCLYFEYHVKQNLIAEFFNVSRSKICKLINRKIENIR